MARLFAPNMPEPIKYKWMVERVGRCGAQIRAAATAVLAAGTSVILDSGLMRRTDRARVRELAEAADLPLQFHFATASAEVRRARVAEHNVVGARTSPLKHPSRCSTLSRASTSRLMPDELVGAVVIESA